MPTCHAVSDTQDRPMASSAMAHSATEICSPVDSSISISRLEGRGLISPALAMRSSVVSPWAESTTITSFPARYVSAMIPATLRRRWASRTLLPPNFCTIKLMLAPSLLQITHPNAAGRRASPPRAVLKGRLHSIIRRKGRLGNQPSRRIRARTFPFFAKA